MPITYEQVLPWGRSFDEYRRMFGLTDVDLGRRILGCGDGPAAFNAAMCRRGYRVVSVDPLYRFGQEQIEGRIAEVTDIILEQTYQNRNLFRWDAIRDIDELKGLRHLAMREFLEDYPAGLADGRYVAAELPLLPQPDKSFDLAICSHFLFLYSDQLDLNFHIRSIDEILRVAAEVRIFPVVDVNAKVSPHLEEVICHFSQRGNAHLVTVDYEFQIGANQMLRIRAA